MTARRYWSAFSSNQARRSTMVAPGIFGKPCVTRRNVSPQVWSSTVVNDLSNCMRMSPAYCTTQTSAFPMSGGYF